jgi:hypothetical protein
MFATFKSAGDFEWINVNKLPENTAMVMIKNRQDCCKIGSTALQCTLAV